MKTCNRLAALIMLMAVFPVSLIGQRLDTVRAGSGSLRADLLMPGTYEHENYRVEGQNRILSSRTTQTVEVRGDTVVIRTTHASSSDTSHSMTMVHRRDLALVHHEVRARRDSTNVTVNGDYLTGWSVLPGAPTQLIGLRMGRAVFPVEGQIPWLMGLLPLREGYRAAVPHFSEWTGKEGWDHLEVAAEEHVIVNGRGYDCWRVDAGPLGPPGYRMTRWIDSTTRRVVQSALRGPAGQTEYWSWMIAR
jgi:hypothetical protein